MNILTVVSRTDGTIEDAKSFANENVNEKAIAMDYFIASIFRYFPTIGDDQIDSMFSGERFENGSVTVEIIPSILQYGEPK